MPSELPALLPETRAALHRVAAHVLARRRHAYTGRFGLQPAPGGMATPAFGDDMEVVRTSGAHLVTERAGVANRAPLTTLAAAAELAGVDLGLPFAVGDDTPEVGDPEAPLGIDDAAARVLGGWFGFGVEAVDALVATEPAVTASEAPTLWPGHFDVGCAVTVAGDGGQDRGWRLNLGASGGDAFEPLPYLYVGPHAADRPGGAAYWNAPFGAVLRHADLAGGTPAERLARAVAFLREGIFRFAAAGRPPQLPPA